MHIPLRTCVGCRVRDEKFALTRFVLVDGELCADPDQTRPGRGSYLHPRSECIALARQRGGFSRSHRRSIDATVALDAVIGLGDQGQIR